MNVIEAKEVLLTETHLALVMEYAAGNSLTGYVADKWQHAQHTGLFLSEDEARYFFRVCGISTMQDHAFQMRAERLNNVYIYIYISYRNINPSNWPRFRSSLVQF